MPTLIRSAEAITHPADWDEVQLGDVATFHKGSGLSKASLSPTGRYPCILYGELFTTYGAVIDEVASRTDTTPRVVSRAGDVLMPTSDVTPSGLAKASAVLQDGVALGGDILVIRPDPERVVPEFLAYAIRADDRQVLSFVRGSTVYHLYASDMRNFSLRLPPVGIQKEIAQTLQDFNQYLKALNRVIAKKRQLAMAIRNSLLTGSQRLHGFSEAWELKQVSDLGGHFVKGGGIAKQDLAHSGLPCVLYGELYTHHHDWIRSFRSFLPFHIAHGATRLLPGDVLFAGSGETAEDIGTCAAYLGGDSPAYAGGDIVIWRGAQLDPCFAGYALNAPPVQAQKSRLGQGATILHISAKQLAQLEVLVPPTQEEQAAIAKVLRDIDGEIEALAVQGDKYAQLQTAMTQALLSGQSRLR